MLVLYVNYFLPIEHEFKRTLLLNQSVAKPKTLDISTHTSRAIRFPGFSFDELLYAVAVVLERVWVKKPGEENSIRSDVDGFRFCN